MMTNRLLPLAVCLVTFATAPVVRAQDDDGAAKPRPRFVMPPDVNGLKTIVPAPDISRPVRIAIYDGPGSGDSGVDNVEARARQLDGAVITRLSPAEVGTVDLTGRFDVIVFSGGSGSAQSKAIGDAGRTNVREFVRNGGGYVGVCAGAYLACAGFDWGLGVLDARTVSSKWRRGQAVLELGPTEAAGDLFGSLPPSFKVRYNNGPILKPLGRADIPDFTPVTLFLTETAENDTPVGVQIGSPAQAIGTFGKGRVFVSSPHPENTPGLEHMIPRALLWSAAGGPAQ
jgi:hypothetical protein